MGVCSKVRVYLQGAKQGEGAAHVQKTRIPQWIQARVLKDSVSGEGHRMLDQLVDLLLIGWW